MMLLYGVAAAMETSKDHGENGIFKRMNEDTDRKPSKSKPFQEPMEVDALDLANQNLSEDELEVVNGLVDKIEDEKKVNFNFKKK